MNLRKKSQYLTEQRGANDEWHSTFRVRGKQMRGSNATSSLTALTLRIPPRSLLFHPLTLFLSVWSSVVLLYSLHLSYLLIFSSPLVFQVALWILLPFAAVSVACICCRALFSSSLRRKRRVITLTATELFAIDRLLWRAFGFWVLTTILEIYVSGGIPIVWLLQGSSKTYFDFGIPSVHGFLNSLLHFLRK